MLGSSEISESGVKVSSRILQRYVLQGEQVEVATRQHWAKMTEPVLTVFLTFMFVSWISSGLERAFGDFGLYLWWVWFALIGRLLWKILEWRNEWFVATDKRLLLTYGLFTHKVAMMPLGKVTDLNYGRSLLGRVLGYGDFTLESAGQDQALRKINWLPDPDQTYRRICDIIFSPDRFDSDDSLERDDPDEQDRPGHRSEAPESHKVSDHEEHASSSSNSAPSSDHAPAAPPKNAGWQTSRESASTYQRVKARKADSDDDDDDITGPIPTPEK